MSRGLLINRFRGRRELFDEGRLWLERHTGVPVLGVMPWLEELFPPEDSLDLLERRGRRADAELTIAVLRLPSLSNFSDLDPLEAEPSVHLRWIRPGDPLGSPDAVILPGSKMTLRDLAALRSGGLAEALGAYVLAGGQLFGICGGLQMLGEWLEDPEGRELGEASAGLDAEAPVAADAMDAPDTMDRDAGPPHDFTGSQCSPSRAFPAPGGGAPGLGLLPLRTRYGGRKVLRQRLTPALWPPGDPLQLEGFELHQGLSDIVFKLEDPSAALAPLCGDPGLGCWRPLGERGGLVAGTYLHGIFENGPWRRRWLNLLRRRRGLEPLREHQPHHGRQRDQLLDRLADAFEAHVDLTPLLR